MIKAMNKTIFVLMLGASSMMMASGALAQGWPLVGGDYWEVTGIDIKDGGGLKYANWLADEWRKSLEFSKSKGWIKDYVVFSNVHREGRVCRAVDFGPRGACLPAQTVVAGGRQPDSD